MKCIDLLNLPHSIQENIIQYLNYQQKLNFQLVHSKLRKLCLPKIYQTIDMTFWKGHLVEDSFKDQELIEYIEKYGKFCDTFLCHYMEQIIPFLPNLSNLSRVQIKHGICLNELATHFIAYKSSLNTVGCLKLRKYSLEQFDNIIYFENLTKIALNVDLNQLCSLIDKLSDKGHFLEHLVLEVPQLYLPIVNLITRKFPKLTKLVICSTNQNATICKHTDSKLPKHPVPLIYLKELSIRLFDDLLTFNRWLPKACFSIPFWLNYFHSPNLIKLNLKTPPLPNDIQKEGVTNTPLSLKKLTHLSAYKLFSSELESQYLTHLSLEKLHFNYDSLSTLCELPNLTHLVANHIDFDHNIPSIPFTLDGCIKLKQLECPYGHFELGQLSKLIQWFPNATQFSCFLVSMNSDVPPKIDCLPFVHINITAQPQAKEPPVLLLIEKCKDLKSIKLPKHMLTRLHNDSTNSIDIGIKLGDPYSIWYKEKFNDFSLVT